MIGRLRRAVARRAQPPAPPTLPATDGLTIVTPSFEKHLDQFGQMVESLVAQCRDLDRVTLVAVVESVNVATFAALLARYPALRSRIVVTEDLLSEFGIGETPSAFLRRIGKFTFQSIKKFGGLRGVDTEWSLVLDSEGLFHKPFRAMQLLDDYRAQKYVFYTETAARGALWRNSTGYQVTRNAAAALGMAAGDRWYMEYFHWFYETAKVRDLIDHRLGRIFFEDLANPAVPPVEYFENVLYYLYLEKYHAAEYDFVDFKAAIDTHLPARLSARYKLSELPFALFGNEYLLNILSPDDVADLQPLFDRYKLPFIRLEPPVFSTRYLPELARLPSFVATISSHHAIWLRRKIAVCISGEFRHIVHRVPEQQVRHLLGFLAGVDCDIYIHGWSNSSEALIVDGLKPRAYVFEQKPSFSALARRIKVTEPNIKPGRDEGSLAMFYGIERAHDLMTESGEAYDYVLRIRPDLYSELSLKELLVRISDEGDFLKDAIYFPRQFHSKGINDQIALGPVARMAVYARTFSYIEQHVEKLFFNPETVLLRHLLEEQVALALVDMPYALLREIPFKIGTVHEAFHRQFHIWWSRTEDLPSYQDLTAYFTDKLAAMDAMMRRTLPDLLYVRTRTASGAPAVLRTRVFDNDPSRPTLGLFRRFAYWRIAPFVIGETGVEPVPAPVGKQVFVFPQGNEVTVSEWRMADGRLVNGRVVAGPEDVDPGARRFGVRIRLSFYLERREQARARARERPRHWLRRGVDRLTGR